MSGVDLSLAAIRFELAGWLGRRSEALPSRDGEVYLRICKVHVMEKNRFVA